MAFELFKESYTGSIKEIEIGSGEGAVVVGGESSYPFYQFEGAMPNHPKIAMEIWDMEPDDWPEAALAPFKDVVGDPAAWAKKCVEAYGAELIVLQLKSTDPNTKDTSPDEAAATVKKVLGAINVPLIVWGTANTQKDEAVLKKIAEACQDHKLTMGPVEDKNHKGIGAAAMGYGHAVISSSPIDVNLAKQVNILLENLGVPMDRVIVDPTTGGLGYGLEYSYSVMERIRMAALAQGDDKLQFPIINNLGNEVWKCKEAKQPAAEAPILGDPERRAILMEAVGAVAYLMAGSDILIMRHPEAIRLVRSFIGLAMAGGDAADVAPIAKQLDDVDIDFAALAPAPDLTIEEEKKAAPAKKAAPEKKAEAAKPAAPAAKPATPAPAAPKAAVEAKAPAPAVDAEAAAKAKEAVEAKAKADAAAKIEAEAAAKAKAEADAKAKAEADAKAKLEAEANAAAAKQEKIAADEDAIRALKAKERKKRVEKKAEPAETGAKKAVAEAKSSPEKILELLDRIHRRVA